MLPHSSAGHPGKQAAQRGRWKVSGAGAQREGTRLLREVLVDGGRLLAELLHTVERVAVLRDCLLQAARTHTYQLFAKLMSASETCTEVLINFRCLKRKRKLFFPHPSQLGVEVLRRNLRRSEQRYVAIKSRDTFQYFLQGVNSIRHKPVSAYIHVP